MEKRLPGVVDRGKPLDGGGGVGADAGVARRQRDVAERRVDAHRVEQPSRAAVADLVPLEVDGAQRRVGGDGRRDGRRPAVAERVPLERERRDAADVGGEGVGEGRPAAPVVPPAIAHRSVAAQREGGDARPWTRTSTNVIRTADNPPVPLAEKPCRFELFLIKKIFFFFFSIFNLVFYN